MNCCGGNRKLPQPDSHTRKFSKVTIQVPTVEPVTEDSPKEEIKAVLDFAFEVEEALSPLASLSHNESNKLPSWKQMGFSSAKEARESLASSKVESRNKFIPSNSMTSLTISEPSMTEEDRISRQQAESDFEAFKKSAVQGTVFQKLGRNGKFQKREVRLTRDGSAIRWKGRILKPGGSITVVPLAQVRQVTVGMSTGALRDCKTLTAEDEARLLSLVLPSRTVDLFAPDPKVAEVWRRGLQLSVANLSDQPASEHEKFLRMQWAIADKDCSGSLDKNEVVRLANLLNVSGISAKVAEQKINEVDKNGDGELQFEEFEEFMRLLQRRDDVASLYNKYKPQSHDCMTVEDFHHFLQQDQHDTVPPQPQALLSLVAELEGGMSSNSTLISETGFAKWLDSSANGIRLEHCEREITDDMKQPLSHYWINSSHNTYLTGDQLRGKSSVDAYRSALQQGCRCVELDCWDGENGQPIIYHGHTLTSKISFEDVISVIHDSSFYGSCQYPVILSIEMHCSLPQQEKMAEICERILGQTIQLLPDGVDGLDELPSPEELKNKILIKGKRLKQGAEEGEAVSEEEDEGAEEEAHADNQEEEKTPPPAPLQSSASKFSFAGIRGTPKVKKINIHPKWSRLVYLDSIHFKGFGSPAFANQMSSFAESKMGKLSQSVTPFRRHSGVQLARVYPAGFRVDSTNYDPTPAWAAGAQLVALNFQTGDRGMWLNHCKFANNGGCGYLLKPKYLTGAASSPDRIELTVEVLSGQKLPKPGRATKGEVIDPFVVVEILGRPGDRKEVKTRTIQDNGFNPIWGETFSFTVSEPEVSLLSFTVYDEDTLSSNDFIGCFALPVSQARSGIRSVRLKDEHGAPLPFGSILVRITKTESS